MKIISIIQERLNGVTFYRSVIPHSYMVSTNGVKTHFTDTLIKMDDKELASYDAVVVSYHGWDDTQNQRLAKLGVKLILDVDDFWSLSRFHELYNYYKENNRTAEIIKMIKAADAITTTTTLLAERIYPYNQKVGIFNNALMDDDYKTTVENPTPQAAWLGAGTHTADLMLIQHLQKGFGIPVHIPEAYRLVFKDKFSYYPPQQIPEYLGLYSKFDIILAPLRKDEFNSYKSALKFMEAAAFSKALIISDVEPFSPYLKHKENCLKVRKKSEWQKWLKMLANDRAMREELGSNLHKDGLIDFNLEDITKRRYEFYKEVVGV